jgi:uncharacterized protein
VAQLRVWRSAQRWVEKNPKLTLTHDTITEVSISGRQLPSFVGRQSELAELDRIVGEVRSRRADRAGRCLLMRGRRRVGKSRLLEQFCAGSGLPSVFFTASRQGRDAVALFCEDIAASDVPGRELFADAQPATWDAVLRLLAAVLRDAGPTIVVMDEFPYLVADDPSIEAVFQKHWDRSLSRLPLLLVLVGSDLAMMEALNTHGRAFFQRGTEMVLAPFSPADVGEYVGSRSAADAFDAYLVTGGLPLVCREWPHGVSMRAFLRHAVSSPTSALLVSGERVLAAEFPVEAQARDVMEQIGSGERTFTTIARASGGITAAALSRSLSLLGTKRIVARDLPVSTRPSKEARYRIADPYLRFWLAFIGPHIAEIERGRGDRVLLRILDAWPAWRGRAIEPIVREALARMSHPQLPDAAEVGGWWPRTNAPEIDVIGADRGPVARRILYAGTIKWREREALDQADVERLIGDLRSVPGAEPGIPIVGVSRTSVKATGAIAIGPDDLIAAWH